MNIGDTKTFKNEKGESKIGIVVWIGVYSYGIKIDDKYYLLTKSDDSLISWTGKRNNSFCNMIRKLMEVV